MQYNLKLCTLLLLRVIIFACISHNNGLQDHFPGSPIDKTSSRGSCEFSLHSCIMVKSFPFVCMYVSLYLFACFNLETSEIRTSKFVRLQVYERLIFFDLNYVDLPDFEGIMNEQGNFIGFTLIEFSLPTTEISISNRPGSTETNLFYEVYPGSRIAWDRKALF